MRVRWLLAAIALGLALRLVLLPLEWPHGDVLLDTGVARSLMQGRGFHSGFDRGTAFARGELPVPAQDLADQHPPLWPLLGAGLGSLVGDAFTGLRLGSLLAGLALLVLTWRATARLVEGVPAHAQHLPALATALVALSFLMLEFSADGALYMAQAALVLLLAEALAVPSGVAWRAGLVLGAAWLLNHQAVALLPVPVLALALAAPRGERLRGAATGLLAVLIAAALQLPWWWRNALAFGDPFHSTNAFYTLNAAGLQPVLGLEQGVPVARMPDVSLLRVLLGHARGWLPGNLLYLALAGMLLWPGLAALLAAGAPALGRAAWGRDRRLAALLLSAAALLGISLLWPDLKLRYLVPLTPVVVVLGVRLLAAAPTPGERRCAWIVALAWLALLAGTWHDIASEAADARPERWKLMAVAGPLLLLLPLWLRHARRGPAGPGLRLALVSGVIALPLLGLAALLQPPHTSYHANALLPDIFGSKLKDLLEAREHALADRARQVALRDGARVVCGPLELLAFEEPALITLPYGGSGYADEPLAALVDAGRCDHVITPVGAGWPEAMAPGTRWLGDRLEVVELVLLQEDGRDVAGATVSRVLPR
jgi:4-amino-4-deoxy-L-arabinose transferase-like glycosyltransferase